MSIHLGRERFEHMPSECVIGRVRQVCTVHFRDSDRNFHSQTLNTLCPLFEGAVLTYTGWGLETPTLKSLKSWLLLCLEESTIHQSHFFLPAAVRLSPYQRSCQPSRFEVRRRKHSIPHRKTAAMVLGSKRAGEDKTERACVQAIVIAGQSIYVPQ